METPVLTKNQQKRSLSGKKKPRDKCLRNVLVKPKIFSNLVPGEAVAENIIKILESTICVCEEQAPPSVETDQCDDTKKKSERNRKQKVLKEKGLRKYLCLGVNEVARAVENGQVSSVVLEKDVDPQFMVSHIGTSCTVHNIPYVVVPGLRNGANRAFGFPCICLGVKAVGGDEDNPFMVVHHCILEAFHTLSSSKSPTELRANSPVAVETLKVPEMLENIEDLAKHEHAVESTTNDKSFTAFYKYRTNAKERVFIPGESKKKTEEYISLGPTEEEVTSQNFTGISVNFTSMGGVNLKRQNKLENKSQTNDFGVEYRLHEIKRLRPNPDKKRKMKAKKIKTVK